MYRGHLLDHRWKCLQLALNVLIRVVQNRSILYFWVTIYSKNRRVTIGTYLQNKTIQKGKYLPVLLQKSPFESNGGQQQSNEIKVSLVILAILIQNFFVHRLIIGKKTKIRKKIKIISLKFYISYCLLWWLHSYLLTTISQLLKEHCILEQLSR